jgi:hypothetical protein
VENSIFNGGQIPIPIPNPIEFTPWNGMGWRATKNDCEDNRTKQPLTQKNTRIYTLLSREF